MHHPSCIDPGTQNAGEEPWEAGNCLLGREGHCRKCPHRGQSDPRWSFVYRLQVMASSVEGCASRGHDPRELIDRADPDVAARLWPESEREWIERENRWVERACYHAAMATTALIRELLTELHDAKAAAYV